MLEIILPTVSRFLYYPHYHFVKMKNVALCALFIFCSTVWLQNEMYVDGDDGRTVKDLFYFLNEKNRELQKERMIERPQHKIVQRLHMIVQKKILKATSQWL